MIRGDVCNFINTYKYLLFNYEKYFLNKIRILLSLIFYYRKNDHNVPNIDKCPSMSGS